MVDRGWWIEDGGWWIEDSGGVLECEKCVLTLLHEPFGGAGGAADADSLNSF